MSTLLGFEMDFWDYATFAVLLVCGVIVLGFLVWLAGVPGRIAIARKHPDTEAVRLAAVQYRAGTGNLLAVLQLQAAQTLSQANVIQLRNARLANRITLHLAIGGSFDTPGE